MDYLIVSALHKCRVDVAKGNHSLRGKACRKSNCMLLSNAYVKGTVGHGIHHDIHGAATGHGRSDANNLRIFFGKFYNSMPKYILVLWRGSSCIFRLMYFPRYFIKQAGSMPFGLIFFCKVITFTLYG